MSESDMLTLAIAVQLGTQMEAAFGEVQVRSIPAMVELWESWSCGKKNVNPQDGIQSKLLHRRGWKKSSLLGTYYYQKEKNGFVQHCPSMGSFSASMAKQRLRQQHGSLIPANQRVKKFQVGLLAE